MEVRLDTNSLLQFYDLAECTGGSFAHKLRTESLRFSDTCVLQASLLTAGK